MLLQMGLLCCSPAEAHLGQLALLRDNSYCLTVAQCLVSKSTTELSFAQFLFLLIVCHELVISFGHYCRAPIHIQRVVPVITFERDS